MHELLARKIQVFFNSSVDNGFHGLCGGQLIPYVQFAWKRARPMAQYPVRG